MSRKITKLLNSSLKTNISKEFGLEDIGEALNYYENNMSLGKVVLKPSIKGKNKCECKEDIVKA